MTLQGVLTALVTPLNRDGSLDLGALDALVDSQLKAGVQGLVPCGTTGEAATLTASERDTVIERVVQRTGGRVPVVAGTGAQGTAATCAQQRRARELGASHGLVVTPFYNKPTPEGLVRHYREVAAASPLPVVVYNVPGRTACDITPDTLARLADVTTIVGIKEATADLDRVAALRRIRPDWALLSGDDGSTCAFTLLGGHGVISVASNVAPEGMTALVAAARAGDVAKARAQQDKLRGLFAALFLESSPIPVKAAMAMQGRVQEVYRLPLCEMQPERRAHLRRVLEDSQLL